MPETCHFRFLTINRSAPILVKIVSGLGRISFTMTAVVLNLLPMRVRNYIADASGSLLYMFKPVWKSNIRENLSCIGIDPSKNSVLGILRNHARNIVEMFASSRWETREIQNRFTFEGKDVLDDALTEGKGVIVVTAHVGNWELAALYLSSLGYDLHVVAGIQMNRFLSEAVKEAKERRGIRVIRPEHSYRRLFNALASNGIVVLLVDGDIYIGGAEVEFFGTVTTMPRGAVQLGRRTGAPIIGGYCRRLPGGRYHIHLERLLNRTESASLTEAAALKQLYRPVERFIKKNSDQWCMFRRLWGE